jgi:hypothetical protein
MPIQVLLNQSAHKIPGKVLEPLKVCIQRDAAIAQNKF